ncbi:epoxide hydrolase, soluble (sEH), partial [Coemansia sp. RSA 2708]
MDQEQVIPVNHDDFIHDVAYNFYGTRLATCGSDRCIKVWDWNRQSGLWILSESIGAHDSAVVRLSWAHPEFGQVLASCSLDCTVRIWVEQESARAGGVRWRGLVPLGDSKAAVHSIAFAPEYTSLSLAAASSDGRVRLYSPNDPVHLDNWSVKSRIEFVPGGATDADGPLCVSWCKSRFAAAHMLAVGGSRTRNVKVYRLLNSAFVELLELAQYDCHVLDIDWAPTMGRSYHLIATACADGRVRIYKFWSDPALAATHLADSLFVHGADADAASSAASASSASDDDSDASSPSDDDSSATSASDASIGAASSPSDADRGAASSAEASGVHSDARHAPRRARAARAPAPRAELVADIGVQPSVPVRRVRWNSTGTLLV